MSEDFEAPKDDLENGLPEGSEGHSDYKPADAKDVKAKYQLSGMYQNWFLDYASYVILERAVPHINDGLKPVQRRILHSMRRLEDGRYNKVANIVGHTMQFHPHGDASIGDALVQLGQKDLLVDCQGNWGNILTGDGAAAPRYIEARLSKFALDVVFNPKTTEWKLSYDGRNKEPVTLPVKFPLLLAQGVEGIAVGLSSKILPHNFNELCDASISYLRGEEFQLYPDFQTGGSIDVAKYNDGERGGAVKVRAKINKIDNKTLAITEIPYGKTTSTVIDSILKAVDKGKIKIRKVDDNTAANVEILVHLAPGTSSDKTIDALYAFTDCEVSISPNCCVIDDSKPHFLTVSKVLRKSADNTLDLLKQELEIKKNEILEALHFASLEKIFIEERIYKDKEFEQSKDMDAACAHIDERLTPYYPKFIREVTKEDILKLMEIKMGRILKFNSDKADELIARMKEEVAEIDNHLAHIVDYTVNWYQMLKNKYGKNFPRRTELRNFDTIEAAKVVEANEKLYINREEGFIGTALKKDEFVACCSDIDDVIIFFRDGGVVPHSAGDPVDGQPEQLALEEPHRQFPLLVPRRHLAVDGVEISGDDVFAQRQRILLIHIPVDGIVDMLHRLAVLQRKLERQLGALIQRADGGIGGDETIHLLLDDLLNEGGNILIMVVKGVAVDAAILHDAAHADFAQGILVKQLHKGRFYGRFRKIRHDRYLLKRKKSTDRGIIPQFSAERKPYPAIPSSIKHRRAAWFTSPSAVTR